MSLMILFLTITSTTLTIPLASTPLTLGLWILFLAFMIATTITLPISSWFGFILFIVYIGGLLVMFAYFAAIDPNSKLKLGNMTLMTLVTLLTMFLITSPSQFSTTMTFYPTKYMSYAMLFTNKNIPILLIAAMILFLALISVVKITQRKDGPLRPFNIYV